MNNVETVNIVKEHHFQTMKAVQNMDWSGLAQSYSENAVVMLGDGEKIEGREAIKAYYKKLGKFSEMDLQVKSSVASGDLCYEIAEMTFTPSEFQSSVKVQALFISRLQSDGEWRTEAVSYSHPRQDIH
ncbi:MAG: nuclear transport factor 2 family protein [Pseudomonadales bacterium]|nr:nuclear transport factor 2 family protein [Pseudomonadales bacterium]